MYKAIPLQTVSIYTPHPYQQHQYETGYNFISKNVYQKLKEHHPCIFKTNQEKKHF